MINVGDIDAHFRDKETLNETINRFGKEEVARRLGWLHDVTDEQALSVMDDYLTGNYQPDDLLWGVL